MKRGDKKLAAAYKEDTRNADGSVKNQEQWMKSVLSGISDSALYSTEIKY